MDHINPITGYNMGGVKALFFTDQENILSFPDISGLQLLGEITLKPNTYWYRLTPTPDTCEFKELWKEEFDGLAYYPEIKLQKGNNSAAITTTLWEMHGRRLVFIIFYGNGMRRVAGNQDYFLKLANESSSETSPRQRPGESLSFKGENSHPALFYSGPIVLAEETVPGNGGTGGSGSSEPVIFRKTNGEVLLIVEPGKVVEVRSGFRLDFNVIG
ncbi:MAG: hypothetical protein ACO1OQ_12825 [Rufibacter sp.]